MLVAFLAEFLGGRQETPSFSPFRVVKNRRRGGLKIRVVVKMHGFQRLDRRAEEPGGIGQRHARLHRPGDDGVFQGVRHAVYLLIRHLHEVWDVRVKG